MASARKNTKKLNSDSRKRIRETAKILRDRIREDERQLRAIERLLDEEFVSLAQAKRELKKNTVQVKRTAKSARKLAKSISNLFRDAFRASSKAVPKQKPKAKAKSNQPRKSSKKKSASKKTSPKPPKKSIPKTQPIATPKAKKTKPFRLTSTRAFRARKGESTLDMLARFESYGDDPDKLLKQGERFMFTYGKGRSKKLYGSFDFAVKKINEYKLTQAVLGGVYDEDDRDIDEDLAESITIVKTSESADSYVTRKEMEENERRNERRRQRRRARAILKEEGIEQLSPFGGQIEIIEKQNALIERQKREIEKLKKGKKK